MKRFAPLILGACAGFAMGASILQAARAAEIIGGYPPLLLFSNAFEEVQADYIQPVQNDKLIDAAIQGMVSSLDPHSIYMDAKAYRARRANMQGEFHGIGIQVIEEDGLVKVLSPIDGTPAAEAGIKTGDRITAVDGASLAGLTLDEAIDRMAGPVGSPVTLTIQRDGTAAPFDMTLNHAEVAVNAPTWRREGDIAYIRLPDFNEHTAEGLEKGVGDLRAEIGPGIRGYVLDLRNNPGGLLDQAIRVADDFLSAGGIVSTRGRNPEDTQRYDATPGDITDGKPLVVLINAGTASASEIVAGALKDHRRATVIGLTSFGKGSVQTVMPLGDDGGALALTTARYYTPSGHSIQAQGIIPDIAVAQDNQPGSATAQRSEAALPGHLRGETIARKRSPAAILPEPGKKYSDFELSYALDLLRGNVSVAARRSRSSG